MSKAVNRSPSNIKGEGRNDKFIYMFNKIEKTKIEVKIKVLS